MAADPPVTPPSNRSAGGGAPQRGESGGRQRRRSGRGGGRPHSGNQATPGGGSNEGVPAGETRGGQGQRPASSEGGRNQGGRPAAEAARQSGRSHQGQAAPNSRVVQAQSARARRRPSEEEAPNLQEWAIEHLGYTIWMAHAQILPRVDNNHACRTYVVDIHAGEEAVNPRLWPAIIPFLDLEVVGADHAQGARRLLDMFRTRAAELGLPPVADYLVQVPPVEAPVSSPVQAALDTAMPMELDHPQEDIDVMNEGRTGVRLPRGNGGN